MRIARKNFLFTHGNLGLYPANQNVFNADGDILVAPGQAVVFNPRTNKSIGVGATIDTNPTFVVAVAEDLDGDGISDSLRAGFGDIIHGGHINAITAQGPSCGLSPVKDIFFKCTNTSDTYSVEITVENSQSRHQRAYNQPYRYVLTVKAEPTVCDTCDDEIACGTISCLFVDKFKGSGTTDPYKREIFTQNALRRRYENADFEVVPLYAGANNTIKTTKQWCVNPVAGDCESCADSDFLFTTATYTDENDDPQTITFTGVANAGGTATLMAQVQRVVKQINTALDGNGHAVIVGGVGKCCPLKIELNTCFDDFAITGLAVCGESNPFLDPVVKERFCKACDAAGETTYTCGFRVIAKGQDYKCGPFLDVRPTTQFIQKINIHAISGFKPGSTYVKTIQDGREPVNLGYHLIYEDYKSDKGGMGRDFEYTNERYGSLGLPGAKDRYNSVSKNARCAESYCTYSLMHNLPYHTQDVHGGKTYSRGLTVIAVPSGDSTTKTDWEAFINAYNASTTAPLKVAVTCSSDQDQNASYPDFNGQMDI